MPSNAESYAGSNAKNKAQKQAAGKAKSPENQAPSYAGQSDAKKDSGCKIGIECHLQLDTSSKLFCGCPTKGEDRGEEVPNSRTCPICLGHPGSRPVLNKKALDYGIKLALALDCTLSRELVFSRKTYFYPDMAKNFQITQFEIPLGSKGSIRLKDGKKITLQRIHLEEDPAALYHDGGNGSGMKGATCSLIDYNRSGIPLCEIVTDPCLSSPAEAREFLKELLRIVKYLSIYDENNGVLKADLNISIPGHPRAEIKNVSGFKDAEKALNYELVRQRMAVKAAMAAKMAGSNAASADVRGEAAGGKTALRKGKAGGKAGEYWGLLQETRAWDGSRTISLRSKETEADYGYIIEPDLPVADITEELLAMVRKEVPELAHQRAERYIKEHKLEKDDAEVMAMELELAELFEKVAREIEPRLAAKWLRRELLRVLNYNKKSLKQVALDQKHLIELLSMVESGEISETTGQKLMEKLVEGPFSPRELVKKWGLAQVTSELEIKDACAKVVQENKKAVADYKSGNEKSFHFLVGQVMKATKGRASPGAVNKALRELAGIRNK